MRFLLLTILIAGLFFALVAAFIVPTEDLRAAAAKISAQIPDEWTPSQLVERFTSDEAVPPEPVVAKSSAPVHGISAANGSPIGDWTYSCTSDAAVEKSCTLTQQIVSPDGDIVFSWIIRVDPKGQFSALWQTKTGIMVNRGLILDAGTKQPITLPYASCVSGYCQTGANLADDFIETLLTTNRATATVQPIDGQPITHTISTQGLADGLRAMRTSILKS